MRIWRRIAGAGAWCLATGLGALVVWIGLRPVLDAAVPDRAVALPAADARHMTSPPAIPTPKALPTPAVSRATAPRSPSARPPGKTASPASPTTTTQDGWTVTTKPDGTVTYVRSFHVTGGDAVIGMTPGRVYLISATPRAGYTVQTEQPAPTRLVVRFIDGNLANLIDAIWYNDAPYSQVS